MATRPVSIAIAVLLLAVAYSASAFAKGPVALTTSISGQATPPIEAFSELKTDSRITLAADSEIEFVHYPTCQTIVVKGGRLSFSSERYFVKNGKILKTKRAKCPKTVVLAGASKIGGLVLRGGPAKKVLKVGPTPTFVLVGKNLGTVAAISVSQNGRTIAESANPGRSFEWPENAPSLEKGKTYTVTVNIKGTTETESFTVESKGRGTEAITLIRLD